VRRDRRVDQLRAIALRCRCAPPPPASASVTATPGGGSITTSRLPALGLGDSTKRSVVARAELAAHRAGVVGAEPQRVGAIGGVVGLGLLVELEQPADAR
jgi:hypothetical protein